MLAFFDPSSATQVNVLLWGWGIRSKFYLLLAFNKCTITSSIYLIIYLYTQLHTACLHNTTDYCFKSECNHLLLEQNLSVAIVSAQIQAITWLMTASCNSLKGGRKAQLPPQLITSTILSPYMLITFLLTGFFRIEITFLHPTVSMQRT